jgi:hypothetical protein
MAEETQNEEFEKLLKCGSHQSRALFLSVYLSRYVRALPQGHPTGTEHAM